MICQISAVDSLTHNIDGYLKTKGYTFYIDRLADRNAYLVSIYETVYSKELIRLRREWSVRDLIVIDQNKLYKRVYYMVRVLEAHKTRMNKPKLP